jgi:hypothetical protein
MPYPVHQAEINFLEWSSLVAVRDEVVAVLVDTTDVADGETASPKPLGLAGIVMPTVPSGAGSWLLLLFELVGPRTPDAVCADCAVSRVRDGPWSD